MVRKSNQGCSVKVHLVLERVVLSSKRNIVCRYRVNDHERKSANRIYVVVIQNRKKKQPSVHSRSPLAGEGLGICTLWRS